MKKIKKLLTGLLAATMVLGSVLTVNANPSIDADPVVPDGSESFGYYEVLPLEEENFGGNMILFDELTTYNAGGYTVEELLAIENPAMVNGPAAWKKLKDMVAFTAFFDVQPVGDAVDNETHKFTIHIPTLTKDMKTIKFLHYSLERNKWEVITPSKVDYNSCTVTLKTKDLSPFMGFYSEKASSSNNGGSSTTTTTPQTPAEVPTSPKTADVASTWALWMAAAVVFMAAGTVVVRRKNR